MAICISDWEALFSSAASDSKKSIDEPKLSGEGKVNLLTLKSPKYARQQVAQIIILYREKLKHGKI